VHVQVLPLRAGQSRILALRVELLEREGILIGLG
jgi:hypothetical protein